MRLFILFTILFLLFSSCRSSAPVIEASYEAASIDIQLNRLTNQLIKSLSEEKKSKIAIMEFPDLHGNVSELGKFIPEELTTRLFLTRRFDVVERSLLNKVLEEQNLGMTGLVDVSSAARVGKMLGVEAIVTGTITDLGQSIRINARVIATETAGVFAVSSVSIEKDEYIVAMMQRFETMPVQQTVDATGDPHHEPTELEFPKIRLEDVSFEVVSAVVTNDHKAIIDILITNVHHFDKEITVRGRTSVYDNMGQQYGRSARTIGSNTRRGTADGPRHLFITNVPTRLRLEFSNIDPRADSFPLLDLNLSRHPNVSLRNIPFERQN